MSTLALLLFAACTPTTGGDRQAPAWSGESARSALVWQGFEQHWGYNHRLNSLGDYVGPLDCAEEYCDGSVVHTAASGSGADTATYTSRAELLRADGVDFVQGSFHVEIDLLAEEGRMVSLLAQEKLPLTGALADRDQYHLVLNGFDLYAIDDADKLVHLTIELEEPALCDEEVQLTAKLDLELDCDSLECDGVGDKLDASVQYVVEIPYLLIAADAEALAVTRADYSQDYTWEDESAPELERDDIAQDVRIVGESGFSHGVLAFNYLSIDLDDEHHMAEWATQVREVSYDAESGTAEATLDMMFKQWNEGSLDFVFSYTDSGAASTAAGLSLLQVGATCAGAEDIAGSITWAADGSPATSAAAVQEHAVAPGSGCG